MVYSRPRFVAEGGLGVNGYVGNGTYLSVDVAMSEGARGNIFVRHPSTNDPSMGDVQAPKLLDDSNGQHGASLELSSN
jgi:hypothetical protein